MNPPALNNLVRLLMRPAWRRDRTRKWELVTLLLTDHVGMRGFHADWMDDPETTDVLSRAFDPHPGRGDIAELIVNAEMALDLGPRFHGVAHELAFYIAHGIDHLGGSDDATPRERRQMHRRELRWLERAHQLGLLETVLAPGDPA